uniref:Uncharacterized protein n=1 Tax=Arundo donax TaxID=35708 RepID=A0A0A9GUR9_ARUDO
MHLTKSSVHSNIKRRINAMKDVRKICSEQQLL